MNIVYLPYHLIDVSVVFEDDVGGGQFTTKPTAYNIDASRVDALLASEGLTGKVHITVHDSKFALLFSNAQDAVEFRLKHF